MNDRQNHHIGGTPRRRPTGSFVTTAALALFVALALAACGSDGATSQTAETESVGAPGTEETGQEPAEDGEAADNDAELAEAVALGDAFMAAHQNLDAAAIQAIADPDASILEFGFWRRTPDEYDGLFQWMEILDWAWFPEDCTVLSGQLPVRVQCPFEMTNAWSLSRDLEPVPGQFELAVEDGVIIEALIDRDSEWNDRFGHWGMWLEANHPDDIPVLFRSDDDGNLTGGPATDPDALALYETRIAEYIADQETTEAGTDTDTEEGSDAEEDTEEDADQESENEPSD